MSKFQYRPEIDGLRAVAVLSVVLFHMGFGCPGGFVGVDVFFVISGFLITSLIWRDLENGTFSFANFWERRARRIAPALLVMVLVTFLVGSIFLLPDDFQKLGQATASQAAFAGNIHYWLDSGYFAGESEEKPLLHTWSLAVEEQFYLLVPLVLWGAFRTGMLRSRAAVLALLLVGFVISFAGSLYGVVRHPSAAFYLLPTRAWELLLGSIIAFIPLSAGLLKRCYLREFLAVLGLALILVPVFVYTSRTPFPGLAALPPCLGAGMVVWGGGEHGLAGFCRYVRLYLSA